MNFMKIKQNLKIGNGTFTLDTAFPKNNVHYVGNLHKNY